MDTQQKNNKQNKFLSCQVSIEFFNQIEEASYKLRMNRSEFIRSAIAEKLRSIRLDNANVC